MEIPISPYPLQLKESHNYPCLNRRTAREERAEGVSIYFYRPVIMEIFHNYPNTFNKTLQNGSNCMRDPMIVIICYFLINIHLLIEKNHHCVLTPDGCIFSKPNIYSFCKTYYCIKYAQ